MPVNKILIVDDSATDRQFLFENLTKLGYQVTMADSGEQAIERASAEHPDLILMDVVMSGMNGFQATRELGRNDATRDIPVIICTSKNQETDRIWGLRQGAIDYIVKPIDMNSLATKIALLA